MKNIRTAFIVVIAFIIIYFLKDIIIFYWKIHNWYEIIVSYFLYLFLPTTVLSFLSFFSYKNDFGWNKKIATMGIIVTILSVISLIVLLVNDKLNSSKE
ncbi:MAG: hypothetical protein AAB595_01325 [Patescibacteria group bacterium]